MSAHIHSVEEVAGLLKLRPKKAGGKVRYIGANPTGTGATKDGFTLFPEGNAKDNNGTLFNSPEVARMAGIEPHEYAPVASWLAEHGNGASGAVSGASEPFPWENATIFEYRDEKDALLFQVGRVGSGSEKRISQRRSDGRGGWIGTLGGVRRVLYRLGEVLAAKRVLIFEGEKAVEAARSALADVGLLGTYVATCNPGGAGKWKPEFCSALAGKEVFVFPDNDEKGAVHASALRNFFDRAPLEEQPVLLRRVVLPDLPAKGDVVDFLNSGGSISYALELAESAPEWRGEEATPEPEAPRFPSFSFADIDRLPEPLWLVQELLVERTASVLSADSGSFKSFFALDMALCVATGRVFHGRAVKRGPVVYVAAEGFYTLKSRATAWARFHGVALPENFRALQVPVNVSDEGTLMAFAAQFAAFKPSLVVLDTLSQNALGLNENSNDEMARFMAGMMHLGRVLGAHVQVVHHNSKAGNLRGAGAIHNNADAHISLERPDGDTTNTVFVRCEKQRGKPFGSFTLRGEEVELPFVDEYGEAVTSLVFQLTGEVAATRTDGRRDRTAQTMARIIDVLRELRGQLRDGGTVSKSAWLVESEARGICRKSVFYDMTRALEEQGKWFFWKGDCRIDEDAESAECDVSDISEKSAKGIPEIPESAECDVSDISGFSGPLGGAGNSGKTESTGAPSANLQNGQGKLLSPETGAPPSKRPKRTKKVAVDGEPYSAPQAQLP